MTSYAFDCMFEANGSLGFMVNVTLVLVDVNDVVDLFGTLSCGA